MISLTIVARPASKKNNRRNYGHISLPSVAYENFRHEALWQIKKQWKGETIKTPVQLTLLFKQKGRMKQDIDNACNSILDILKDAGVIEDDDLVFGLHADKKGGFPNFETFIMIEPYTQS